MEKISCTAPIGLAELKRKFTEEVEFEIDYDNSRFKGKTLITYLSNLDITVRLKLSDPVEAQKLVADYLTMPAMVKIADLEDLAMNLVLAYNQKPYLLPFDPTDFLVANQPVLEMWTRRLFSLPLYAMYSMGQEYRDAVHTYPEDKDDNVIGLNFVHLIKHPLFAVLLENMTEEKWTWNKTFFNEYVFAGNNLFNYFAVQDNPLFIGLLALQDQESYNMLVPSLLEAEADAARQMKELSYVPSV
ncbi:hypothetical protein D3C85_233860 [compost metagenome]